MQWKLSSSYGAALHEYPTLVSVSILGIVVLLLEKGFLVGIMSYLLGEVKDCVLGDVICCFPGAVGRCLLTRWYYGLFPRPEQWLLVGGPLQTTRTANHPDFINGGKHAPLFGGSTIPITDWQWCRFIDWPHPLLSPMPHQYDITPSSGNGYQSILLQLGMGKSLGSAHL